MPPSPLAFCLPKVKRSITRATDSRAYTVDIEFRAREIVEILKDNAFLIRSFNTNFEL